MKRMSSGEVRRLRHGCSRTDAGKAIDRCALDRFERNATVRKPDQKVTCKAAIVTDAAFGNLPTETEIVDERKDDRVEANQCCGRQKRAFGYRRHLSSSNS